VPEAQAEEIVVTGPVAPLARATPSPGPLGWWETSQSSRARRSPPVSSS